MEQADAKIPDLTIIHCSPPVSIMLTHPYSAKSAKPERGMTGPATSRQGCSPEKGEDPHRGFSEASSPARRATPNTEGAYVCFEGRLLQGRQSQAWFEICQFVPTKDR